MSLVVSITYCWGVDIVEFPVIPVRCQLVERPLNASLSTMSIPNDTREFLSGSLPNQMSRPPHAN